MRTPRFYAFFIVGMLAIQLPVFCQSPENGKLISRSAYQNKPFASAKGLDKLVSKEEYDAAFSDQAFQMERLTYASDGLTVSAYLYHPRQPATAKLPVVVFNRGGYVQGDIGNELLPMFHRLAKAGFIVIAPMYRGSDGAEGKDEVGGDDRSVDPQQTFDLASALHKLQKPFELHIYAGDNHTLSRDQLDRDARVAAWFRSHMR